ncbi:MAG TPA: GDP-mannose 4,6-dehydratase [Nocardioides sp.]|uniref:GDP-mannose 4,6-dehydratase n=1 Tax=Nocardioides sp. TaxID=35761 RepID=UPI002BE293D0|nr:GDP-mannose 4,6-dehydratase [Nocardioides sp.]HQR27398.1 GDP-mannose 4,6-dehydratase [Nocardioides sp.]
MTRALVTGISGQDGSYLAERLLADGLEVHALHHDVEAAPAYCPDDVALHPGDLTDLAGVRRLVLDLAPDEVYNLAAISSVAQSWEEPELTAAVNGTAAVALMESAWQSQEANGRPVRFVQASSAEIFGQPATSPQDEQTPVRPVNPYGAAKAHAHRAAATYRDRGLHVVSAILYNHESPRRPTRFVTRKITSTVAAIAQGRADRLVLGNLEARRDWGWAPDYVDALVRAARTDTAGDFVVATGVGHSVREFAATAFRHAGIPDWQRYVVSDAALVRPVDAVELRGDPSRAHQLLGWRPTVDFDTLVRLMLAADLDGHPPPPPHPPPPADPPPAPEPPPAPHP